MIGIKHIKELVDNNFEPTNQNYLLVQSYFEAYLKRLLFIALRKNGLQYSYANELLTHASNTLSLSEQTNLVFHELCAVSYSELKDKDKKLKELEKCIFNYVRPVRNKLAHGADHRISLDIIDLCIKITQEYVKNIENHLYMITGASAFDEPRKWGAKRVSINAGISKKLKSKFKFKDANKFTVDEIKIALESKGIKL
jgi:hypothetical protein